MKRIIPLVLIAALFLGGCDILGSRMREPVTFYYLRANLEELGPGEDLFVGEAREASGHLHDLSYLMALYLIGPTAEELVSPLPRGTRINSVLQEEDTVYLVLSETDKTLTDIEYSLACSCLALTCLELTNAQTVAITSGERSQTITRDSLIVRDEIPTNVTEDNAT